MAIAAAKMAEGMAVVDAVADAAADEAGTALAMVLQFEEAEQHGYVLLFLLLLVNVKCWVHCRCRVCFNRCRSGFGVFGLATHGQVECILLVFH